MTGYVALLRGINVGKAKRIAMADLRALLEGLGYTHVKTVLNSGNAVFDATGAVAENPLGKVADNPSRYMVVFTQAPAALAELEPLTKRRRSPEAFAIGRHAAFLWCPNGILDSALNAAVSAVLGDRLTARNWATVGKIAALAR